MLCNTMSLPNAGFITASKVIADLAPGMSDMCQDRTFNAANHLQTKVE